MIVIFHGIIWLFLLRCDFFFSSGSFLVIINLSSGFSYCIVTPLALLTTTVLSICQSVCLPVLLACNLPCCVCFAYISVFFPPLYYSVIYAVLCAYFILLLRTVTVLACGKRLQTCTGLFFSTFCGKPLNNDLLKWITSDTRIKLLHRKNRTIMLIHMLWLMTGWLFFTKLKGWRLLTVWLSPWRMCTSESDGFLTCSFGLVLFLSLRWKSEATRQNVSEIIPSSLWQFWMELYRHTIIP